LPAVQLSRLNQQLDVLVWQFTRPSDFLIKLHDLFDLYADRVYRAGQAVPPTSMVPAYHIPQLILRQMEIELRGPCKQHPAAALALVDVLWAETMLEPRLLGATLLGHIPLTPPETILNRLYSFAQPGTDSLLLTSLMEYGGRSLRQELPARWIELIESWANETLPARQAIALRAIVATTQDENFVNLPPLFRIFSRLLQVGHPLLQAELQTALLALLHRSPKETIFLLRQVLPLSTSPTTHRLVRLSLSQVPIEHQAALRQALHSQQK
jgi:hypothetical protein